MVTQHIYSIATGEYLRTVTSPEFIADKQYDHATEYVGTAPVEGNA